MTEKKPTLLVLLNPLRFNAAETPQRDKRGRRKRMRIGEILRFLAGGRVNPTAENLARRYREFMDPATRFSVVPYNKKVGDHLIAPLQSAIVSYMLGNYIGSIALSGFVCEVLTVIIYEMHRIQVAGRPISSNDEERLFGRSIEKLDQSHRLNILFALGIISDSTKSDFDEVRKLRNRYMHVEAVLDAAQDDAKKAFRLACSLFDMVFKPSFQDGAVSFRPQVSRWLTERGGIEGADGGENSADGRSDSVEPASPQ